MEDLIKSYACPHCGELPRPESYKHNTVSYVSYSARNVCYKMQDGRLAIPIQKMKPLQCCEGYYVAPYHFTPEEYLDAVKPYFGFFAPTTTWIKESIKNGLIE
jgi:hypothetical protein